MRATMPLVGLYNYDNHLFDEMEIPQQIDKKLFVENLLSSVGDVGVIYPDLDFFRFVLKSWSKEKKPIWEKLYITTTYEYNAINNYDRTEERTLSHDGVREAETSGQSTNRGSDVTKQAAAAYNDESLKDNRSETTTFGSGNDTCGRSIANDNAVDRETARMFGNIGVTTTQQMIREEREVVQFDVIQHMIDDFKSRFLYLVY